MFGDGCGRRLPGGYVLDDGRGIFGSVGSGDAEGVELGVELVAAVLPHDQRAFHAARHALAGVLLVLWAAPAGRGGVLVVDASLPVDEVAQGEVHGDAPGGLDRAVAVGGVVVAEQESVGFAVVAPPALGDLGGRWWGALPTAVGVGDEVEQVELPFRV